MTKTLLIFIFLNTAYFSAQNEILYQGNQYLNNNEFAQAENVFRKALESDNDNLIYKSQLSLALMEQGKYDDAQVFINEVLKSDSLNLGALWYDGLNNFLKGDFQQSVGAFLKYNDLIDSENPQYGSANYFIGKNYQNLLYSSGIEYDEIQQMLKSYNIYLRLNPDAQGNKDIQTFVNYVEKKNLPKNVRKWIIAPDDPATIQAISNEIMKNTQ